MISETSRVGVWMKPPQKAYYEVVGWWVLIRSRRRSSSCTKNQMEKRANGVQVRQHLAKEQ